MATNSQKADEPITDINVTPLVDVCLVLVIIFMAIAPFAIVNGINILESRAKAAEGKVSAEENVKVNLAADGKITVNGAPLGEAGLAAEMVSALQKSKDKMVVVSADDKNRVGEVVEILDTAKQAGALKLAILKTETAPAVAPVAGGR